MLDLDGLDEDEVRPARRPARAVTNRARFLSVVLALLACRLPAPATTPAVGAEAPDFELRAADGAPFRLADRVHAGPLVLVFYRGHW